MAVFSYNGGIVSMATGSYGNLAIRKGAQISVPNTITTSARSFVEGTPAAGLFDPIDRGLFYSRISHGSGYNATKINFNTTEPYNNGAYSTSSYYTPYNTVFQDLDYSRYNTQSPSGEYWAHAQGYVNSEFGTSIAVDKNRNAWVVGSTDYCSCSITSITASLTAVGSFTNSTTTPNSGTNDSGFFNPWSLPFNQNIFGLNDNNIVVQSNSWISFQPLVNNTLTTFTGTSPAWANIQIGAGEASCQRLYWGTFGTAPSRTFRIRYEGTNATTGTLGSPNMVWEFILYESNPNIFDIQIGTWNPPATNASGISDGTTYFSPGTFVPTANTGWRFNTGNVTAGSSGNNITLVKYSSKGQFQRNKDFFPYDANDDLVVLSIGRNGSDVGEAVKIGSDGRIYILYTSNSQGYVSGVANNDLGVVKLDPDFLYKTTQTNTAAVWTKTFGTTSGDSAQSFDIDKDDNLYISGFTVGSGQGGNDVIVIKVDKTGRVVWKKTYGAGGGDLGNAIKLSPDGNHLYIWGYSASTPLVGTADWFVLKVNPSTGSIVWQKHFNIGATTGAQVFENSIDVDPDGNVYVNGFASSSPQSYFVAKLDSNGNFKWSRNVGAVTSQPDAGTSVKYKNGFLYVGGQDSSTVNNSEGFGLGVSKLDPNTGQLISNYVVGGVGTEYAFAMDIDDYGDIYATGAVATSMAGLTSATGVNALTTKFILDTPQGGFTLSGNAGVWSSITGIKRYTTSPQAFAAEDIVFQNDLIATGQQFIFVGTTSETQTKFEKEFRFSGSGSLPGLISAVEQIPLTTTQYLQRTNVLSDATEYTRVNISSLLQVSGIPNPISGVVDSPTAIYNAVASSNGGAPAFLAGYITPVSSTGTFAAGTVSVLSIFAKTNTWNKFTLLAYSSVFGSSGALPNHEVRFDLDAGTATNLQGTNPPLDYGIIPYSNGWYRCWIKVQSRVSSNQSGGSGWFQFRFSSDSVAGSSIYWYGPQLQKDILTSYVENTSSTTALTTTAFIEDNNVNTELTFNPSEDTQLFSISGAATIKYVNPFNKPVQTYAGYSELAYLSAYEIVFDPDIYVYGTEFQFSSPQISSEKFEKEFRFTASGTFTTSGEATAIKRVLNPPEDIQLFTITNGYSNLKSVDVWVTEDPKTISVSGAAVTRAPNRHIGSSPTEYITASAIVFGNEENIRTVTDGDAKYQFIRAGFTGSGTIIENPNSTKRTAKVAFVQINTIILYNTNVITKLAMLYAGKSPSTPFGGLDIVFEELEPNAPPQQFKYSGAASEPLRGFRWVGVGNVQASGAYSDLKATKDWVGSGSLLTDLTSTSKVTFNPVEDTTLFVVTNGYSNLKSTNVWIGTGSISITGEASPPPKVRDWTGNSPFEYFDAYQIVFEDGENFYPTEFKLSSTALYSFEKPPYAGSGSLFTAFGAAQATRVNPPEDTFLFSITGAYSNLKATKDWVGTGSLFTSASGVASVSFNTPEDTYLFSVSGTVTEKYGKGLYTGDGNLFTASGAAQATGANPPEDTFLFSVTNGYSNLKATKDWVGTGSVSVSPDAAYAKSFAFVGASPVEYFSAYEIVFGEGDIFDVTQIDIDTNTLYEYVEAPYFGQGTLLTGLGGTAKVRFNPPEDTQLFQIGSGYSSVKATNRETFSGSLFTNGFYSNLKVTFNPPEDTYLFSVSGTAVEKNTEAWVGTGTLFNASGAAEATGVNPPEDIYLFAITNGYSDLRATSRWIGSGSTSITGGYSSVKASSAWVGSSPVEYFSAYEIVFGEGDIFDVTQIDIDTNTLYEYIEAPYFGSGTLFSVGGAAEATRVNPPEDTFLFSITGAYSNLKATKDWVGTGSLFTSASGVASVSFNTPEDTYLFSVSGSVVEKHIDVVIGSGNLFNTSGAAEAFGANPPEDTFLFSVTNGYSNLKATKDWVGSGSTSITGSGVPSKVFGNFTGSSPLTYYDPYEIVFENEENFYSTEFQLSNYATFRFIPTTEVGSGSLFSGGFVSGTKVTFNPPEDTYLFSISGQHGTRVFVPNWIATGTILTDINGTASVRFNPPEDTFLFSVTGAAVEKNTEAWVGSGNLFTASGASQSVGANPPEDTYLFSVSGTAGIKLRDFVWISPIVEFDPYELVINDEFTVTDYIDLRNNVWDSTNNITRSAITETFTSRNIASGGSLFGITSLVERVTFNPAEDTYLFSVSGNATQKHVDKATGSGSLFTASGAAEATGANPPEDTFLFSVTGTATEKHVDTSTGSGSTTLSGSLIEDVTFAEVGSGTATFGDGSILALKWAYNVTGGITISEGATASVTFNPVEDTTLFVVSGAGVESQSYGNYTGSGSLFTDGFYSNLKVTFNPPEDTYLYTFSGSLTERTTGVEIGSGNLFNTSGAAESFGANPPENTFLFSVTGTLVERTTEAYVGVTTDIFLSGDVVESFETSGYQGRGSLFTAGGAAEVFGANPPENTFLYEITGAYSDLKATSSWVGSGSSTITGEFSDLKITNAWEASGTLTASGTALESYTRSNYDGSGSLFTFSGSVEAFGANPPEDTFLFEISGAYSDLKATSSWVGSGNLFNASGAAEAFGANPPEDTVLFSVAGAYSDLKSTSVEIGSGSLFTDGFYSDLKVTFNPSEDTFLFSISGQLVENKTDVHYGSGSLFTDVNGTASVTFNPPEDTFLFTITEGYSDLKATFVEIGSGNLFNTSGAAEAFGANPPEDTFLFSVTGSAIEANTEAWVGSGSSTITGEFSDLKITNAWSGSGTVSLTGNAIENQTNVEIGSGSLFAASGSAEAFGANPPEDTYLFLVSGNAIDAKTDVHYGSGSIFTDINGTASVTFNPPENTFLYEITGAYSDLKATVVEIGTGSVATLSGAAERITWNPVEDTQLFVVSGSAVASQLIRIIGSGSIFTDVNGTASVTFNPPEDTFLFEITGAYSDLKAAYSEIGSGVIASLSGAAERVTWNPVEETQLYTITGEVVKSTTNVTAGSGSLFTDINGTASVTFNPPEDTFLYSITGAYSDLKATYSEVGTGSLFTASGAAEAFGVNPPEDTFLFVASGAAVPSQTSVEIGSGSLFTDIAGVAAVTFNPPEDTFLFSITEGYSDLKATYVEIGTGSLFGFDSAVVVSAISEIGTGLFEISDTAIESTTYKTIDGSGSLFEFGGAVEAFGANPPENTVLFIVDGAYSDLKATYVEIGTGSLFGFDSATEAFAVTAEGTGLFEISDTAFESRTYANYDGSGELFSIGGGVESVTFNPVEDTTLFEVSGDAYITTTFGYGGGTLQLSGSGEAIFARALVPQVGEGSFFSSGDSQSAKIFAPFIGSGSLFSVGGSSSTTTSVPVVGVFVWASEPRDILYVFGGSAKVNTQIDSESIVLLNITGSGSVRTVLPERIFATII